MGTEPRPFLKWAGGKQKLLPQFEPFFPESIHRYLEPFLGGGAVFFHLRKTGRITGEALLCDNNSELVNAYRIVRDHAEALIGLLERHRELHSREHYYDVRNQDRSGCLPAEPVEQAARTIYLNRTCYNGLYRVNSRGYFNVPQGRYKNPAIVNDSVLYAASTALKSCGLETADFRQLPGLARKGDFIYLDPPYLPISRTSNFTAYTAAAFTEKDQRDLAEVFEALSEKGCLCMLSNSRAPLILDLYKNFRVESVRAGRAVSSRADGRGPVTETVVMNY